MKSRKESNMIIYLKKLKNLKTNNMAGITTYLSILTISLIKRHRLVSCIKKQDQKIFYLQETHLIDKGRIGGKRFSK
jgi:hypothetical protein